MNYVWTEEEERYIRDHAGLASDEDLARMLSGLTGRDITRDGLRWKRKQLGIKKAHGRGVCRVQR